MVARSRVPAVTRAAEVLHLLARSPGPLTVSGIAQESDLPRTSVQGICDALARDQMLTRGADGTFWLGPRVAALGAIARLTEQRARRFGVLVPNLTNAYYTALLSAAQETAEVTGSELVVHSADDDSARQHEQWEALLDEGVDAILLDAVETYGFEELIIKSREASVPVVAMGTRIDGADASVTSDNTQAGQLAGHELAQCLPAGSRVAIADGLRKNANADRVTGFLDALRDHPDIRLVAHEYGPHDDAPSGRLAARRILAEHPDVDGIFAVCDPIAIGVAEQVTRAGHPVPITAVDGRAQVIEQIRADGPIIATAAQDPARLIRAGIDLGHDLCDYRRPTQSAILLPVRLLTNANASGYEPWG